MRAGKKLLMSGLSCPQATSWASNSRREAGDRRRGCKKSGRGRRGLGVEVSPACARSLQWSCT